MASRTKQKEEARARRLAEEQARAERERRQRRLRMIGGVVLAAIAVVVVAIVISTSGGGGGASGLQTGANANKTISGVETTLSGIPQSGSTLGNPNAPVTVTEFGDLQCPICAEFSRGAENTLINKDVRAGKVKLVYRSLMTATGNGPNPSVFPTQQAAALAAGLQQRAWHYILLFYEQQGAEGTNYVNDSFLNGLAKQISGLNFSKWQADRSSPTLTAQVNQDQAFAGSQGYNSTPTIVVKGPKGQAKAIVGATDYATLEQSIKSVS